MAAHYSEKLLQEIHRLKTEEGQSYKEIASSINRMNSKNQPNDRGVMEAYTKWLKKQNLAAPATPPPAPPPSNRTPESTIMLNEMTRNQRYELLKSRIGITPRTKYLFNTYSDIERELFIDEYEGIIKEMDTLTAAEEQQLFLALNNFVLALRAQGRDKLSWDKHEASLKPQGPANGIIPRIEVYDTRYTAEYNDRMKQYIDGIRALKMSREQRLKDIAKTGNTFLDFSEILAKKENQLAISEEVFQLESKSAEELEKLQANGWVIFGKSTKNNMETVYNEHEKK